MILKVAAGVLLAVGILWGAQAAYDWHEARSAFSACMGDRQRARVIELVPCMAMKGYAPFFPAEGQVEWVRPTPPRRLWLGL